MVRNEIERPQESTQLDNLLHNFREVNEANHLKLTTARNLKDMIGIKIEQPQLQEISKKKVKKATN